MVLDTFNVTPPHQITGMVLGAFDVFLAEPHAGGYTSTLVLPMRPGLRVTVTPRQQRAPLSATAAAAAGH